MKKKYIGLLILILTLFVIGCSHPIEVVNESVVEEPILEEQLVEEVVTEEIFEELIEPVVEEETNCTDKANCLWDEQCIDGICGKLDVIYDIESECGSKCNFDNVHVSTSDGDSFVLPRGQGSYTSAGAVEWKLISSKDYCKGEEDTPVAIKLLKKNYGKIISEEVIILEVGEESNIVTHPTISTLQFTLTVDSIDEVCS
jgi:hypothetical protein